MTHLPPQSWNQNTSLSLWYSQDTSHVGEIAMAAKLLDDVLLLTCVAAFFTGITIAAVALLG